MEENKKPEIRFKGFTDTWEQRKLDDFGVSTSGTSIESEFDENGRYNVISIGSYSEQSMYNEQGLRCRLSEKTRKRILNKDDLTMILNDKTASGKIIGRVLIIDKSDLYMFNQRTQRIEPYHNKYDATFLYEMLNAPQIRYRIFKQSQGNTQIYVNWSTIKELEYLIPNIDEQRKLGHIFKQIDNLITLHQSKYDNLVNVKKSLLEKMFPKNNETVPEIRFKGFTDAWEQRKLGELTSFTKGSGYSKSDLRQSGTPVILYGRLYTKYEIIISKVDTFTDEKSGSIYSKGGEVIVPASGETAEDISIASVVEKSGVLLGGDLNIVIPPNNLNSIFLAISISNGKPHNDMAKMAQGKSVVHLHNSDLAKIDLLYPNYEEQNKISELFKQIDNLITLHQSKLDNLKNFKNSLLNKMFV